MEAFKDQFRLMRKANQENTLPQESTVRIVNRNFLSKQAKKYSTDLIITSPPYVISYDYADIHQLSALWLGFVSDYRDLRKNMIGNQYGIHPPSEYEIEQLSEIGRVTYNNLLQVDRWKAISISRYLMDLEETATKCWQMLNSKGMTVFVIGNTQYKGVKIENAQYLAKCMERAGFHDIETIKRKVSLKIMTPYRDSRGRFTRDASKRKVYNEEFVVAGRKK